MSQRPQGKNRSNRWLDKSDIFAQHFPAGYRREPQSQFSTPGLAIGKTYEYKFARPATYSLFMAFCNPQSPIH